MAVLLNETSNLRLRVSLTSRISDGIERPAALAMDVAVERYKPIASGDPGAHRFVPMVAFAGKPLLDLDLIQFFEAMDALLRRPAEAPPLAVLEASTEASLGLRIAPAASPTAAAPRTFLVEVGLDLQALLEPIGGAGSPPGTDLALFRFPATGPGVTAFYRSLLEEFAGYPTDPSLVLAGRPE